MQTGVIVLRTVTSMRSSGPLPRNLLRVLVVERWAEQVVQQQEGSPPHLGPLITILKFSFTEKRKTANREKKKGEMWASASLLFMTEGTWAGGRPQAESVLQKRMHSLTLEERCSLFTWWVQGLLTWATASMTVFHRVPDRALPAGQQL